MMKITYFGDSFINTDMRISDGNFFYDRDDYDYFELLEQYPFLVARHFDADMVSKGCPGSGSWDAFFQFKKYCDENNGPSDVTVFCWSSAGRLYHPNIRDICPQKVRNVMENIDNVSDRDTWLAANSFYEHLYDTDKVYYEHVSMVHWLNDWLFENYPDKKFIHMTGFPVNSTNFMHPETFEYFGRWDKGVEIRPALIHLSYIDEFPGDLSKETRGNHLSNRMHKLLTKYLIDAIENYEIGRLIDYGTPIKID